LFLIYDGKIKKRITQEEDTCRKILKACVIEKKNEKEADNEDTDC